MTRRMKRKNKNMNTKALIKMSPKGAPMTIEEAEKMVPHYYLTGKAAEELDREIRRAERDHKAGRIRPIEALFKELKQKRSKSQ